MELFNKVRSWLLEASMVVLIALAVTGALKQCSDPVPPSNGQRVDTVLVKRTDTLRTIDTLLKKKTIYRDTGRIEYIHDDLDKSVPPIGDENVCIAENQLRQCMKCQDSLEAYKQIVAVDSQTIDTLTKLAKTVPDTMKITPSVFDRVKDFGAGLLVGAGIRSFF